MTDEVIGELPFARQCEVAAALGLTGDLAKQAGKVTAKLYDAFIATDASQIEINPLAESNGKLLVLDTKMSFDSNALYRKNLSKGQTGLSVAFDLATAKRRTVRKSKTSLLTNPSLLSGELLYDRQTSRAQLVEHARRRDGQ